MSGSIRVEPAGPAHAAVLAALHQNCFDQGWSAAEMLALILALGAQSLIASEADAPAGFAIARVVADEAEVLAIGVVAEKRRRGVGQALLSTLAARCADAGAARMVLEVAADNAAAQALYAARGFAPVGRRAGYYARPDGGRVDALILAGSLC